MSLCWCQWIPDHNTVFKNRPDQGQVGCSSAFFWTGPQVYSQQAEAGVCFLGDGADVFRPRQILKSVNDIVMLCFNGEQQLLDSMDWLNDQHPTIKFSHGQL